MVFTPESDQKPPVEFSKDETKAKEVDKHVAQCKYVMTKCVCLCVSAIVYTIIPGHNLSSIRWVLRRAVGRIVCLPRAAASAAAIRQPNRQSHWQYERWYTGVIGMTYYRDYLSAYRRPITEAPRCLDIWRTVVWKKNVLPAIHNCQNCLSSLVHSAAASSSGAGKMPSEMVLGISTEIG